MALTAHSFDTIVIGSGFGGVMAALPLVERGERLLLLERGDWVARGPQNWEMAHAFQLSPHYTANTPFLVDHPRTPYRAGTFHCVGGPSVFYGGASLRLRERDFAPGAAIVGDSGAEWPFGYSDLAPYYGWAESLLGVAGDDRDDPTAPPRAAPYPAPPLPFTPPAQRVAQAARRVGLHPFPLPLAINAITSAGRHACQQCSTCDGFACAIGAKNDLATTLVPRLLGAGMELRTNTVALQLNIANGRVGGVRVVNVRSGERSTVRAQRVIVAAGTLATPQLLLASGVDRYSPAPHTIGRYLTRHVNHLTLGICSRPTNPEGVFHKQVAIHDFYFGAPGIDPAIGKLGAIQQITAPGPAYVQRYLPPLVGHIAAVAVRNVLALLTIAEDAPDARNHVTLDPRQQDAWGVPLLRIHHRHSPRDRAAARALVHQARVILREAGAMFSIVHELRSFSHALGSVRMGMDETTAPLDECGRVRGIDNLFVSDGSALPTAGGVNPSLTIAANALRIGAILAGWPTPPASTQRVMPTIGGW